jgi:4-amino-4-deoxy-L-arabinose transferase-like glycosyltransferase
MGILAIIACAGALFWLAKRAGFQNGQAVLIASVLWGAILTLITELLSLFHAIALLPLIVCWIAATAMVLVVGVFLRGKSVGSTERTFQLPGLRTPEALMVFATVVLVVALAVIGLIAAPSNSDSMTYHLARVMHWMQNHSVEHYPAAHAPQLYQPPMAEFAILHLQIMMDGDRLAFAVQFVAMLICAVAVFLLARQLGAGPRGQLLSVLFVFTIPGTVLQANSTQNNLVLSAWLVCALVFLLRFRESLSSTKRGGWSVHSLGSALLFGLCCGLATLTKGTGYVFLLPILIWFAVISIVKFKARGLVVIGIAGIAAIVMNIGHWTRNWRWCGSILVPADTVWVYRAQVTSPGLFASNVIRNLALHLRTGIAPADSALIRATAAAHHMMGVDVADPAITVPTHTLAATPRNMGEDVLGNPIHLLLIFLASGLVLAQAARGRQWDAALLVAVVCGGFLLFCFTIKWQMFHARLHLPLFIMAAPFVAIALERLTHRVFATFPIAVSILVAFALVIINPGHPFRGRLSIFRQPREAQYFANRTQLYQPYRKAADLLAENHCTDVGITSGQVWEYPLWAMLHSRMGRWPHIEVLNPTGPRATSSAKLLPTSISAVIALPQGPGSEGVLPEGWAGGSVFTLGRGVTVARKQLIDRRDQETKKLHSKKQ